MKRIVNKILSVLKWVVLLAAFSAMGFANENWQIAVPLFALFFIIVFGLIFLYVKKHSRRTEMKPEMRMLISRIIGAILVLVAVLTPVWILESAQFSLLINILLILLTALIIFIGILAISLINSGKEKKSPIQIVGYLILILLATLPGFLMVQYDRSYNALGIAYYAALIVAVLSWWGLSMITRKKEE